MKRLFPLAALMIMCAMTTVLTSCESETTNLNSYKYEVKCTKSINVNPYSILINYEVNGLVAEFNSAVGWNGNVYNNYSSRRDSEMKSACERICSKHNQNDDVSTPYVELTLYCVASNTDPGSEDKAEQIATYKMGRALKTKYELYSISSNTTDAYAALEAKKGELSVEVYDASFKTLKKLVGYRSSHASSSLIISSAFETFFKDEFSKVWPDDAKYDRDVAYWCDSIANVHAADTLAVPATVVVSKTNILDSNDFAVLWRKDFPVNLPE